MRLVISFVALMSISGCGPMKQDKKSSPAPSGSRDFVGCLYRAEIHAPLPTTGAASRGLLCADGPGVTPLFCEAVSGVKMPIDCTADYAARCTRTDGNTIYLRKDKSSEAVGEENQRQAFKDMCSAFEGATLEFKQ